MTTITYYVYKITFPDGDYYIGMHKLKTYKNTQWRTPINDGYWGSGSNLRKKYVKLFMDTWAGRMLSTIPTYKDAVLNIHLIKATKEILKEFKTKEEAALFESKIIKRHISNKKCLNLKVR